MNGLGSWALHICTPHGVRYWVDHETGEYVIFGENEVTAEQWQYFAARMCGDSPSLYAPGALTPEDVASLIVLDASHLAESHELDAQLFWDAFEFA